MRLAKYKQAPIEKRRHYVDYSEWLDTTELLTGIPVLNIVNVTVPPLVTDTISLSDDGKAVIFYVSGGLDGEEYQVDIVVTTSGGQVREDNFIFIIEDPDD